MDLKAQINNAHKVFSSLSEAHLPGTEVSLHGSHEFPTLAIKLHNKDKRPTVYTLEFKVDCHGNLGTIILDTISCYGERHESKKSFYTSLDRAIECFNPLLKQACDGSKEETLKNYTPLGLFYIAIQ